MALVSLLFSFKGRINRAQFWVGNIGAGVGGLLLFFMLAVMFAPTGDVPKTSEGTGQMMALLGLTMGPAMMLMGWIGLALQTKRFHDRGRSGLWTMLPFLPATMVVMEIVHAVSTGADPALAVASVSMWMILLQLVNLFMLVDLGCMPGKQGPNRYGDPPGGPSSPSTVPGARPKSAPAQSIPGTTHSHALVGAESAIDRAIAARAKQAQAKPQHATVGPAPAGLHPAAPGSFGRKVTQ